MLHLLFQYVSVHQGTRKTCHNETSFTLTNLLISFSKYFRFHLVVSLCHANWANINLFYRIIISSFIIRDISVTNIASLIYNQFCYLFLLNEVSAREALIIFFFKTINTVCLEFLPPVALAAIIIGACQCIPPHNFRTHLTV